MLSSAPKVDSTLPFLFRNVIGTRSRKLGAHRAHRSVYYWKSWKSHIWAYVEPRWLIFNIALSLKRFIVRHYRSETVALQCHEMMRAYSTRILAEDPRAWIVSRASETSLLSRPGTSPSIIVPLKCYSSGSTWLSESFAPPPANTYLIQRCISFVHGWIIWPMSHNPHEVSPSRGCLGNISRGVVPT